MTLMVRSGARGNMDQVVQLGGMRGLLKDMMNHELTPAVTRNFREGVGPLEYYLGSHAARRSMAEKKLLTAPAGEFTRIMVEAAYPFVIRGKDCGTAEGIRIYPFPALHAPAFGKLEGLPSRVIGRCEAGCGRIIDEKRAKSLEKAHKPVCVRSVLTCLGHTRWGEGAICQNCYGWDLSTRRLPDIGLPVGILAGQSIGERGTQLTMRTFHTGGVGEDNITGGLPRIRKLFGNLEIEVPIYTVDDVRDVNEWDLLIEASRSGVEVPYRKIEAVKGQYAERCLGELLGKNGELEDFRTIVCFEAQRIYKWDVDEKHFEVVAKAMLAETDQGLQAVNITKAPFSHSGFLGAASYRSALNVLSEAALREQVDKLRGYKVALFTGKTTDVEDRDDIAKD